MTDDADSLAEPAIKLAASWVTDAKGEGTRSDRLAMERLRGVLAEESGVDFVMAFVDRVARPSDNGVASTQLAALVNNQKLPGFLNVADRNLLRAGARLAPLLPDVVMPLARRRMRSIVGHLVAPAEPRALARHLTNQRTNGYALNVNLLGEAVLGEREAATRFDELVEVMDQPDVDYVSVKISAVASQLNHWDHAASLHRVTARVSELLDQAASASTSGSGSTFVNFDMEEYHDLELTLEAFIDALSAPERHHFEAGIVLQAYLPDSFAALQQLVEWANVRHRNGGGLIKIRLVKGANLAMERVDAVMHGWEQAPYGTKVESDANFKRCLDWVLTESRMKGVRIGLASHNLFDIAWTRLLAAERDVLGDVQFEMLQGMAPALATVVNESTETDLLLYTPAVDVSDFDVAISYLFRRLEENAANDNFMRALLDLSADSASFATEADRFRESLARRKTVSGNPRRNQKRTLPPTRPPDSTPFFNDPETDPTSPANRPWIAEIVAAEKVECQTPMTVTEAGVDQALALAKEAAATWSSTPPAERRAVLLEAAYQLDLRRGLLISTMMHEANKTLPQGDVEVCEAIDFARWYADSALHLSNDLAEFSPFGVAVVVPPWNFPVAITAGGVLASLAAGNAVILKPAPEVPRCAEVIAEALWTAGVPTDVLQFVRTPDDAVGKRLVCGADAVVLTGASQTADLFHSWNPAMRLFAETSGKNALIITPNADLDLAARDLVQSAFGHGGQKCSAASIAILVGDVGENERFRRQVVDAVESLTIGPATDLATDIAPLVGGPNERILETVEKGATGNQRWLVEPRVLPEGFCTPGVLDNVGRGSAFHNTECFGPLLGLINVADLDEAIEVANSSDFGLTGGIHSLDPAEVSKWTEEIELGNGYVNRAITGAIVQRQPFGGWKRSSVGPGAKAGGPNYVMGLGTWSDTHDSVTKDSVTNDYATQWAEHFSIDHDPAGLFCEANIFRYRPLSHIMLRSAEGAADVEVERVRQAASICGVTLMESLSESETDEQFAERIAGLARNGLLRVRHVGNRAAPLVLQTAAVNAGVHIADSPVTASGRVELQHYLREQSMSVTLHRFGNLVGSAASI